LDENQVLACYGSIAAGEDVNIGDDGATVVAHKATSTATASAAGSDQYDGSASAAAGGELPDTGGASLLALGAGALLVAGGLLARRIVR
jgi:LPXTG-motif cell wall-anchored protein